MEASFRQDTSCSKEIRYQTFLEQFAPLIQNEKEEISVLANTSAALKEAFGFFWVGFYLVRDGQLILGPFQGSVACYRIRKLLQSDLKFGNEIRFAVGIVGLPDVCPNGSCGTFHLIHKGIVALYGLTQFDDLNRKIC